MEPQDRLQDRLDALLSSRPSTRPRWSLPESQRDELEPLLDLADDLALVRNVLPASAFADALETRLLARTRSQATGALSVLDEEDGAIGVDNAPTIPALAILDRPGRRASRPTSRAPRVSWKVWTSLAAAILLALTVTTFTVAANAGPGSAFYGVRRWQEDARTNLANSDADRAKLHIQYATDALNALDSAVAQHDSENVYNEALGRFTDEMSQAASALAKVPAGSDHDTLSANLDDLRTRGLSDLRAALPSLSWSGRITTTSTLGGLGESVLTVTKVAGIRSSWQTGHVWTVTITGSGFQTGAILLIRQRPAGHVVSVTATQVVAQLAVWGDDYLPYDIGVGNPDNTAASTSQVVSEHDDFPRATGTPGGDHGSGSCGTEHEDHTATCTPSPSPSPTPSPSPSH